MASFVLASASPRRFELLRQFDTHAIRVISPEVEEMSGKPAVEAVAELSRLKALAVPFHQGELVIAADTLVELDGRALGKPQDTASATSMLQQLSGRWHSVHTGVTVHDGTKTLTESESTRVRFAPLTQRDIKQYVSTGEPMDKAGAYGIQGRGALLVAAIDGDFYNVMGLPLFRLGQMLQNFGVKL